MPTRVFPYDINNCPLRATACSSFRSPHKMARKSWTSLWVKSVTRNVTALAHSGMKRSAGSAIRAAQPVTRHARASTGDWLAGVATGPTGARRYRLYRPSDLKRGEIVPLLVMLHGCRQDADCFAASTRMNRIAKREHFFGALPGAGSNEQCAGLLELVRHQDGTCVRRGGAQDGVDIRSKTVRPVNRD